MSLPNKIAVLATSILLVLLTHPISADKELESEEVAWKKLVEKKEAFYEAEPEGVDQETFERFLNNYCQRAGNLADALLEFQTKFPDSKHSKECWDEWMEFLVIASHRRKDRLQELERAEKEWLENPKLTNHQRQIIRTNQLDRTSDLIKCEKMVRKFSKELKSPDFFFYSQMLRIARSAKPDQAKRLILEILSKKDPNDFFKTFREEAEELKERLDRIGKPVQLKFRSLQNKEIDLADYRGKVVLVQFWATWCPPCIANIPKIKKAYDELHSKGFEVIGISYDEDRNSLNSFVKKNSIEWPQFYSKKGIEASLVKSLGSPGPPRLLVDQQKRSLD